MGDGARGNRDVGEDKEIGEPQPAADGGGIFNRFSISKRSSAFFFDLLEIIGPGGDFGKGSKVFGAPGVRASGGDLTSGFLSSEPIRLAFSGGGRFWLHLEPVRPYRQERPIAAGLRGPKARELL